MTIRQWCMQQLHSSGGICVSPIRKLRNVVISVPLFTESLNSTHFMFLGGNVCLTVCLTEHKICFWTECLLDLLCDHSTAQKNFVQDPANFLFLSFFLSFFFFPLQPLWECQMGISLISQIDGIVQDFPHRQDKRKASTDRYVTVETAALQKRPPDQKECLSHSQLSGSTVTFDMTCWIGVCFPISMVQP